MAQSAMAATAAYLPLLTPSATCPGRTTTRSRLPQGPTTGLSSRLRAVNKRVGQLVGHGPSRAVGQVAGPALELDEVLRRAREARRPQTAEQERGADGDASGEPGKATR